MIKREFLDTKHFGKEWEQFKVTEYEESKTDKSFYQPTSVIIKQMLGQNLINPLATPKGNYDFKSGEKDDGRPIGPSGYESLAELSEMQKRTEIKAQAELEELKKTASDEREGTAEQSKETSTTSDTSS